MRKVKTLAHFLFKKIKKILHKIVDKEKISCIIKLAVDTREC